VCTVRPAPDREDVAALLAFYGDEARGFQVDAFDVVGGGEGECRLAARLGDLVVERSVTVF
jgi:hypothetical protein